MVLVAGAAGSGRGGAAWTCGRGGKLAYLRAWRSAGTLPHPTRPRPTAPLCPTTPQNPRRPHRQAAGCHRPIERHGTEFAALVFPIPDRRRSPLRPPSSRNPSRQIASEAARAAWATTRRSPCRYHGCGRPATLITSGGLRAGFPVALHRHGRRRHRRPRVGGPVRSSRRVLQLDPIAGLLQDKLADATGQPASAPPVLRRANSLSGSSRAPTT